MERRWRYGVVAALVVTIFSLYPQMKMFYLRAGEWNGNYAYNDIDEVAYAAYLKALIDGRPRRNDPYTGRDDAPGNPQPESLFSIQFIGPYTIAIPARILGIGAPWAMTISGAIAAFLTALIMFWLIVSITGDSLVAMAGTLIVIAGGALFAGEGALSEITGNGIAYPYFPGFRRYIPAMAFPAFFLMLGCVWNAVTDRRHETAETDTRAWAGTIMAVLCFGFCVYTYFYVWTAAAAWLACIVACVAFVRLDGLRRNIISFAVMAAGCGLMLVPYAYLLAHRSETMDDVQLLTRTHAPDLLRTPELVSVAVILLLGIAVVVGILELRDKRTAFTLSVALMPLVVFNQQVITGQSLQPIHYQVFIGNYAAALALVLALGIIWTGLAMESSRPGRAAVAAVALAAVMWGFVECHYTVALLDDANIARDEAVPVARELAARSKSDPAALTKNVLYFSGAEADDLPTFAPQPVLWSRHQHVFAGESWQENKERYYQQLYYEGADYAQLAAGMKRGRDFVSMIALFGWGRHTDRLSSDYKPLTFAEIDEEAAKFKSYCDNFQPSNPGVVKLSYLIVPDRPNLYLDNVDRWYSRDAGERRGKYVLFTLTPR